MLGRVSFLFLLMELLFDLPLVIAQNEKGLRYELISHSDTFLLEFRSSTLGWQMIWGKKQNDSTFIPSVSLLIKADEPQKLWKLDHARQKYGALSLQDFPSEPSDLQWNSQKDEYLKGVRRLNLTRISGNSAIEIDTAILAPRYFHDFLAWHFPSWKNSFLVAVPNLHFKGVPLEISLKPSAGPAVQAKSLHCLGRFERNADLAYYFIPAHWMETGIPSGNTPGSPLQIFPNQEKDK
jgi:hypothetical protein